MWRFYRSTVLLVFFISSISFAGVGRVGNQSIGSEEEGFVTRLPQNYPKTNEHSNFLVLSSPGSGSFNKSTDILAFPVRNFVPDWDGYSRERWVQEIEGYSSFVDFIDTGDSCVLAARWVNEDKKVFGVATWGNGKGVIFTSEGSRITWDATEYMLKSVQLNEGACAWN